MTGNTPYNAALHQAFVNKLKDASPAGQVPEIILQRPFPDAIALSNAARKLLAADVDVIVTYGSPATLAALQEKSRVPVVYGSIYDPESLLITGPAVTGCGFKVPLSSLLRYLKAIKPIETLSVVYSGNEDDSLRQLTELTRLAAEQHFRLNRIQLTTAMDLHRMTREAVGDAAFLTGCATIDLLLEPIMEILKKYRVPSAGILPDLDMAGVTLTLYQPPRDQGETIAEMTLQVLAGRAPSRIKSEVSRNTELVFNLKEAKSLRLKIPFQLVAEATKVVK